MSLYLFQKSRITVIFLNFFYLRLYYAVKKYCKSLLEDSKKCLFYWYDHLECECNALEAEIYF